MGKARITAGRFHLILGRTFLMDIVLVGFLLGLRIPNACAQSYEEQGQAAERAGRLREAFQHYMAALRGLPDPPPAEADRRLLERITDLVLRLEPEPAVPEEAEGFAIRGMALLKNATSDDDLWHAERGSGNRHH